MSMSGLGVSIEPLTYREGGDNLTTRKMPGQADVNPITLSRGLFPQDNDNWKWVTNIFTAMYGNNTSPMAPGTSGSNAPNFRTQMYINVLEHPNTTSTSLQGQAAYNASWPGQNSIVQLSFKLYSAWIGSWAPSDMDAGGNAVGVEQLTINYEGFDTQFGNPYIAGPVNSW
jgi:phage tail-like protein